jgi:hypothetical protein
MSLPATGQPVLGADLNRSERISTVLVHPTVTRRGPGGGSEKSKVLNRGARGGSVLPQLIRH